MSAKFIKKWNGKKWNTKYSNKTTFKSPYATTFTNGVKDGTPCGMVVSSISKKTGKNTAVIFKSLTKAGLCKGQKVNGQWIYWPTIKTRANKTNASACKVRMWQNFADWCIASGTWTPQYFNTKSTSTTTFSTFFKNGFSKTVKAGTSTAKKTSTSRKARTSTTKRATTTRHRKTRTSRTWRTTSWNTKRNKNRNTWSRQGYATKTYKFPAYNSRVNTNWRRYARAA